MIDLFFKVLIQTGNSEKAYAVVANEINKRRFGFYDRSMSYEEARRMFLRVSNAVEEVRKLRRIFQE